MEGRKGKDGKVLIILTIWKSKFIYLYFYLFITLLKVNHFLKQNCEINYNTVKCDKILNLKIEVKLIFTRFAGISFFIFSNFFSFLTLCLTFNPIIFKFLSFLTVYVSFWKYCTLIASRMHVRDIYQ